MKKEQKKIVWIITLSVVIVILLISMFIQKSKYRNAIDTKDYFVNRLGNCLDKQASQKIELRRCYNSLLGWTDRGACEFKTFVNMSEEYISNIVRQGYTCNIYEIENDMIPCYECISPS